MWSIACADAVSPAALLNEIDWKIYDTARVDVEKRGADQLIAQNLQNDIGRRRAEKWDDPATVLQNSFGRNTPQVSVETPAVRHQSVFALVQKSCLQSLDELRISTGERQGTGRPLSPGSREWKIDIMESKAI